MSDKSQRCARRLNDGENSGDADELDMKKIKAKARRQSSR